MMTTRHRWDSSLLHPVVHHVYVMPRHLSDCQSSATGTASPMMWCDVFLRYPTAIHAFQASFSRYKNPPWVWQTWHRGRARPEAARDGRDAPRPADTQHTHLRLRTSVHWRSELFTPRSLARRTFRVPARECSVTTFPVRACSLAGPNGQTAISSASHTKHNCTTATNLQHGLLRPHMSVCRRS